MFGSLGSHTYTFPCVDICSAHAYSYCTRGGFALIPDCFGFCGGLIRLPLKLCAKPVCLHVCVYRSVLGVAQFRLLLLVLFYRPDSPPPPPVSSLAPALHYHPAPVQQVYAITSSDNNDNPAPIPAGLFIGCHTPVYIVLISQCVKGMGCNSFPESGDTLTLYCVLKNSNQPTVNSHILDQHGILKGMKSSVSTLQLNERSDYLHIERQIHNTLFTASHKTGRRPVANCGVAFEVENFNM